MNYYKHIVLMIGIAAVFLFDGCSTSPNTLRYKPKTTTSTTKDGAERFTSKDSKGKQQESITEEISDENDSEEFPEEKTIDISSIMQKLNSKNTGSNSSHIDNSQKERMLMEIIKYLDTPYQFGGNSKDGIDCSAFTQTIYSNALHYVLNRSAREQYQQGLEIGNREELQFGDLVFFNTRRRVRPGHVGVYIGDNLFAHSSTKNGVIVSSLDMDYYSKRFMGGRRMDPVLNSKL